MLHVNEDPSAKVDRNLDWLDPIYREIFGEEPDTENDLIDSIRKEILGEEWGPSRWSVTLGAGDLAIAHEVTGQTFIWDFETQKLKHIFYHLPEGQAAVFDVQANQFRSMTSGAWRFLRYHNKWPGREEQDLIPIAHLEPDKGVHQVPVIRPIKRVPSHA